MTQNYFSNLPLRRQLAELAQCQLIDPSEFNGVEALKGKKIVIIGAGPAGLTAAIELQAAGIKDITILEAGHQVGGISKTVE